MFMCEFRCRPAGFLLLETRGRPTNANLGTTTLRPWAGWTGMLDGTSRPTNPEYEPDGIHIRKGEPPHRPRRPTNPIPLPRASLSFLVKQPGGLGCKLHSKCSKCSNRTSSLRAVRPQPHARRPQLR